MAPPSSSSPHLFTPIQEGNESEETEPVRSRSATQTPNSATSAYTDTPLPHHHHHHQRTPLHEPAKKRRNPENSSSTAVLCNNCRPTPREKTSVMVVPLDSNKSAHQLSHSHPSPNGGGLFKSLISGLSRRSPKPSPSPSPSPSPVTLLHPELSSDREANLRAGVAELSQKLAYVTRKRDEAILESSKLKYSMAELEKKLNRLEVYCHSLKSGLEICHQVQSPSKAALAWGVPHGLRVVDDSISNVNKNGGVDGVEFIIKHFLGSVSEARSSIRFLSKALTSQLKLMGVKVLDRLCTILRSYDIKLSSGNYNPRSLQFYLEALLSAAFYEDFETVGFVRNSVNGVLNPVDRSEGNFGAYEALKGLQWEEVLNKGTKHFSEEFSRFCDRKMSEIVTMLGWNRAWPEQLLQAFFGAAKSVWLVHLLANSVHPALSIFRVDRGVRFDPVYMEDMGADKAKKLVPTMVRIMVTPGFYVYDNVVKCKVLSRYHNSSYSDFNSANGV